MTAVLKIHNITLQVQIGIDPSELSIQQELIVNLKITFSSPPKACFTENINDTICYAELISKINFFVLNKKFNLIENFNLQLYKFIKQNILNKANLLRVEVIKKPLIDNYTGICSFTLENIDI